MTLRESALVLERLDAFRVVAAPDAIDAARLTEHALLMRLAPDDALVVGGDVAVDDPHAIVVRDTGWAAMPIEEGPLREALRRLSAFEPQPGLNQGMVAGLPVKVWIDGADSMVIVAAALSGELEERFS